MYSLITLVVAALAIFLLKLTFDKNIIKNPDLVLKIMAVSFSVIGILRYPMSDAFPEIVEAMEDPLQSFLRWGYHIGYVIIPMSVFFKSRLMRNIATCFTLPVTLAAVFLFDDTFAYFVAEGAGGYYLPVGIRYAYYILELAIGLTTVILMQIHNKHSIDFKNIKEVLLTVGVLPLILIQLMPSYIPNSLIKNFNITTGMFEGLHLLWLATLTIEIIVLHFVFRNRSKADRYMFIVFLVIAQVMHTTSPFIRGFTFSRLPLQLCNIAAFFYLYMIIKKDRKVFNFCYLANMVGAAIAMTLTSFGSDALSFWNIHYIYEHSFVVMVPILCITLGIFPRLNRRAIKDMLTFYSIYFAFVFIFGTLINAIDRTAGTFEVNHFYMFNPNVAADYLPFAEFTKNVHFAYEGFEIYPLLVIIIFFAFIALNVIFYFITIEIYKIADLIKSAKKKKKPALMAK